MDRQTNWNSIILTLILLAVIVGGLVTVWSIRQVTQPLVQAGQTIQNQLEQITSPAVTVVPDPVTIVREVRGLSRLETAVYTVEKIITAETRQGVFSFLIGDRLILVAHGQVIAGVDLSKLEESDISIRGGGIVEVTLPEAEVFVTVLDNERSYVFHRDTGVIGMNVELETEARRAAEEEILKAALEDGILDMAQNNAGSYIRHLILALGFDEVYVKY